MTVKEGAVVDSPVLVKEAFVRRVPASYPRCLKRPGAREVIDLDRAEAQHDGYVAALRELGVEVTVLESDPTCPDSPFIEDRAVFCGTRHVIITRSAVGSRSFETEGLLEPLEQRFCVHQMPPGATLDGGDVLPIGRRLYVGHSERTNAAGIRFLERVASLAALRVEPIELRDALHLKSVCSYLGGRTLLTAAGRVSPTAFPDLDRLETDGLSGNVLAVNGGVIVPSEATKTLELLKPLGKKILAVPLSEFLKGNGGPTCLSLRVPV